MAGNWNSGRRRQPTPLKILRGNPGKRRIDPAAEPQPAAVTEAFDSPPTELAGDARARREWRRVAPLLRLCGLVTEAERSALISLCLEWSSYLEARSHLRTKKVTNAGLSPWLEIANRALSQCHRLWHELGLTPSGRAKVARLPTAPAAPVSKWGGLL